MKFSIVLSRSILLGLAVGFSTPVIAASYCEEMISEFQKCEASPNFIEMYRNICDFGDELRDFEIRSYYTAFEAEMTENSCLSRVFKPPRPSF